MEQEQRHAGPTLRARFVVRRIVHSFGQPTQLELRPVRPPMDADDVWTDEQWDIWRREAMGLRILRAAVADDGEFMVELDRHVEPFEAPPLGQELELQLRPVPRLAEREELRLPVRFERPMGS